MNKNRALWIAAGLVLFCGFLFFIIILIRGISRLTASAPEPTIDLQHGQILKLGSIEFEVRHTPGHTPGMCILYVASEGVCFCGDLIFRDSVGRTDLPGGDWETLLKSIHEQVFTLPDETRLLSGHGPETTVGEEKQANPYLGKL